MLPVKLLERVVRQDLSAHSLGHPKQEGVASTDGTCGRRHDLGVSNCLVEYGSLGRIDAVPERGVDDDDHLHLGELLLELAHRLVELGEAGRGPALCRDV